MPIHLTNPSSRRQFLCESLGTLTVLTASSLAADAGSSKWALLADTHIDANPATAVRGVNMTSHLRTTVSEILAGAAEAEAVIINGDCAYLQGLPGDYSQFRELLSPLRQAGMEVHLTLGNHDHFSNFRQAFPSQEPGPDPVPGRHVTVIRTPSVNWFLLDSLFEVNKVTGHLGEVQLRWLGSALDLFPEQPAVLVGHHNPQLEPIPLKDGKPHITGLSDTTAFFDLLHGKPQVQAYVFGHTHRWEVSQSPQGVHLINLPPVAYVFDKTLPSGWVEATVDIQGIRLQLHSLDTAHPAHGQETTLAWR